MPNAYTFRFTTVPLPKIVSTQPRNGDRRAPPRTDFRIVFNGPITPATVMDHISMTPPLPITPTQVFTYYSPWDHSFGFNFGAEPSTDYQVRISPGIEDPYDIEAVRKLGVIDLPTIQKKANFHLSVTLDLFGSEISTNAAAAYEASVKGRYQETKIDDDHRLNDSTYPVLRYVDGELRMVDETAINAVNARLRDDYIKEVESGFKRWNKVISKAGVDFELKVPHVAFNRRVGEYAGLYVSPEGELLNEDQWNARCHEWLPDQSDLEFISSLMQPVMEPGQYANWIAPPKVKVDNKPGDFEFVKLAS